MLLRAGRSCCAKFETGCVALRVAQIVIFKIEVQISRLSPVTCTEAPLLIAYSNVVFRVISRSHQTHWQSRVAQR